MFCKNDYVNYRTQGVCKIEEIRFIQFDPACPGHRYYILKPILPHSADIFVPVDNPRLTQCIRPILTSSFSLLRFSRFLPIRQVQLF